MMDVHEAGVYVLVFIAMELSSRGSKSISVFNDIAAPLGLLVDVSVDGRYT
jgi:hypothetical protein